MCTRVVTTLKRMKTSISSKAFCSITEKITFLPKRGWPTERRTDICFYRVALLLKRYWIRIIKLYDKRLLFLHWFLQRSHRIYNNLGILMYYFFIHKKKLSNRRNIKEGLIWKIYISLNSQLGHQIQSWNLCSYFYNLQTMNLLHLSTKQCTVILQFVLLSERSPSSLNFEKK